MKKYRKDYIVELCAGKNVLHLGFIQHHQWKRKIEENDWLHEKINQVCANLIGVDYLEDDVKVLSEQYGYCAYYGDVTNRKDMLCVKDKIKDLRIDVVICGELIGHVNNVGLFLDNIKMFMNENTLLVITTPNPFSYQRMKLVEKKCYDTEWLNFELINWYSYQSLKQLLSRFNFTEVEYGFYFAENKKAQYNSYLKKIIKTIIPLKRWNYPEQQYDGLLFVAKNIQ